MTIHNKIPGPKNCMHLITRPDDIKIQPFSSFQSSPLLCLPNSLQSHPLQTPEPKHRTLSHVAGKMQPRKRKKKKRKSFIRYPKIFCSILPCTPSLFPMPMKCKNIKCRFVSHSFFQHYELILSKLLKYASIDYVQFLLRLDHTMSSSQLYKRHCGVRVCVRDRWYRPSGR